MKIPWCEQAQTKIGPAGDKKPRFVRCPKCNRRLMPRSINEELLGNDYWLFIPAHKIPAAKVKRTK